MKSLKLALQSSMLKAISITKSFDLPATDRLWGKRHFQVLREVTLELKSGQTVGLVGESGCGKSTLAKVFLNLLPPDSGEVTYQGALLHQLKPDEYRSFCKEVQIIFQDPLSALNPRMRIKDCLKEPYLIHKRSQINLDEEILSLMRQVQLPQDFLKRYPHELSGGERQRVCIARAIALKPKILICDEAVSSLDVLVRAGILNLLLDLQDKFQLALLFISHDLRVIRHMSDEIYVMKDGRIVESGPRAKILKTPQHPYTQELLKTLT